MATERFETIRTAERLAEVGPAWTALWAQSGALVFQSHAWVSAWWASAPDRERRGLAIVLAWRDETLVGVLPLAIVRRRGFRVLEWAAKDCSDFGDALLAVRTDHNLVRRMWRHAGRSGGFDLAYLNRLLPDAAARTLLQPENGGVRLRLNHRDEANWRVRGPWKSGPAWFDAQSKKTRQNYRRGQKFLAERGLLTFRLLEPGTPLGPVLDRLTTFKRAWLQRQDLASTAFYDEGSRALHAMVQVLSDTGLLHAFVLECDGEVVAVSINFVQAGTMMAFVTTYDPEVERASPGMVLMMDYIMWSIDHGLHTVDFLCGDEGFKGRFGTQSLTLASMTGARTPQGAAAQIVDRAQHAWRRRFGKAEDANGETVATEAAV
ncbi:Acetyltransferase involved in cellulose biosynthesis, CelD/BcsL family [Methylobacterium phyllostachyos]|uniref:Acetyltransferase involved in cellulose biosynthesis, CelD/BcsL family n=1 Tax=Methylobacterium phyllostachyos TaxID=582672 RepID=A0A1G9RR07_9HYPH|nr:GNAT family N-acetyltransferase [Methylobacterium phyllostachyos]SDM25510.1 Acetyltransferase involved in cellulose biosynthesis, CelD/BcsL family [Methylobacterium phyllostachyos]